ncbi:hypothetical protein FACS1894105_03790 [Clostridia bacterium]|nr:hypothetical protein FACS1894105_03790 [Clostridia bacterium]
MLTFGEKVRQARLMLNLSQTEIAEKTGISERSLYSYERTNAVPRASNLKKLAVALNVSVGYLTDKSETDTTKNDGSELLLSSVRDEFGSRGVREANELIQRAHALFAGGELDNSAKDLFFHSLMEVYLESKTEARIKFTPKSRISRKKK